jgi:hypothetical protein
MFEGAPHGLPPITTRPPRSRLIDVVSMVAVMSSMPEDITIRVAAEASVPFRIGVT